MALSTSESRVVLRGGTVVDGTGAAARLADVVIESGRIVAVSDPATEPDGDATVLDVSGMVVAPGFVDPHTHYDAQIHWDPLASPSNVHGVTTIIGGNCGFSLAPLRPADAGYIREMMAKVEGMPLLALEKGVEWSWSSFAEYLDLLEGKVSVNAGFLVGHSAIRRFVLGADGQREATADEIATMVDELRAAIDAGGLGFSTSLAFTHSDGDGVPVTSRFASREEILALCAEVSRHDGTSLEFVMDGCLNSYSDAEVELAVEMALAGQRPMNWNVLTPDTAKPDDYRRQLEPSRRAAERGGKIVALTMPTLAGMTQSLLTHCGLWLLPGWGTVMRLPLEQKLEYLGQSGVRHMLRELAASETGALKRLTSWPLYEIGDTFSAENEGLKGRVIADIAAERGEDPFDCLVRIALNDRLQTILWPLPPDDDDASWALRKVVWDEPDVILGGSDAGAHLDRMLGSNYPTRFLADCIRGRKLVGLERAVQMLTQVPAQLFGLADRGVVRRGAVADLVVFDPNTIDSAPVSMVHDLPGGTPRLYAGSVGVEHVFVNGVETISAGVPTGATPGVVLRSGRDTVTPSLT